MAVPTSTADRAAIGSWTSRNNVRSPAARVIVGAIPDQIRIVDRNGRITRWLNITGAYGLAGGDFLLKIADSDIERGTDEQIRGGIVIARVGELPVGGGAGEIGKAQAGSKHHQSENDD